MDSFRAMWRVQEYSVGGPSVVAPAGIRFSTASKSILLDSAPQRTNPAQFAGTLSDAVAFHAINGIRVIVTCSGASNFRIVPHSVTAV